MLEHQKHILISISADKHLFHKELKKSIGWLDPSEMAKLHTWVMKNYWKTHKDVISEVFTMA